MNNQLEIIHDEIATLSGEANQLNSRRADLIKRHADLIAAGDAAQSGLNSAKQALTAALADQALGTGTDEAVSEARKRLASASDKAGKGQTFSNEADAIQGAIQAIDGELERLGALMQACSLREKALLRNRADELAADLNKRQREAVNAFAQASAESIALNELYAAAGGQPAKYAPDFVPAISVQGIGSSREQFSVEVMPLVAEAAAKLIEQIKSEGFKVS